MADKEIFKNGVRKVNCSLFNHVLHIYIFFHLAVVTIWLKELRRISKNKRHESVGGITDCCVSNLYLIRKRKASL